MKNARKLSEALKGRKQQHKVKPYEKNTKQSSEALKGRNNSTPNFVNVYISTRLYYQKIAPLKNKLPELLAPIAAASFFVVH